MLVGERLDEQVLPAVFLNQPEKVGSYSPRVRGSNGRRLVALGARRLQQRRGSVGPNRGISPLCTPSDEHETVSALGCEGPKGLFGLSVQ